MESKIDKSIGKDILIIIILPPNSNLEAILLSPQSLQRDMANSIIYAIPINFIIKDMYIDGISALCAKSFICSTIKFNFKSTDNKITTPAVIAIKFENSGLSFFITKQSIVDTMAMPTICIISKISPPYLFSFATNKV